MNVSSVLTLQADCINNDINVSLLLRKAYVIAKKLDLADAVRKFEDEINGYKQDVPEYRKINGEIMAMNPVHGWIPVMFDKAETHELFQKMKVGQSIDALEHLVDDKKNSSLISHYAPDIEAILLRGARVPLKPALHVSKTQIKDIINQVRKIILDWSLELEKNHIYGNNLLFTREEQAMAHQSPNIKIENFTGVLGDVSGGNVAIHSKMKIVKNDADSLCKHFSDNGIEAADLKVLRDTLDASRTSEDPKVAQWIGSMTTKAITGSWSFAKEKAVEFLTNAINAYFGI